MFEWARFNRIFRKKGMLGDWSFEDFVEIEVNKVIG